MWLLFKIPVTKRAIMFPFWLARSGVSALQGPGFEVQIQSLLGLSPPKIGNQHNRPILFSNSTAAHSLFFRFLGCRSPLVPELDSKPNEGFSASFLLVSDLGNREGLNAERRQP